MTSKIRHLLPTVLAALLLALGAPDLVRAEGGLDDLARAMTACGARQDQVELFLDRVGEAALPDLSARSLASATLEPCKESLPIAPFLDKTLEGLAKGIDPARILSVLAVKLEDYRFAARAAAGAGLQGSVFPADLVPAGESLAAGMERGELSDLLRDASGVPVPMAMEAARIFAFLKQAGFPPAEVRATLGIGFEHRSLGPEWQHVTKVAVLALKRGTPREEFLAQAAISLAQGEGLREFMGRLGFAERNLGGTSATTAP